MSEKIKEQDKVIGTIFVKVKLGLASGNDFEGYLTEGLFEGDEDFLTLNNKGIIERMTFGSFVIEAVLNSGKSAIKVLKSMLTNNLTGITFEQHAPIYISIDSIETIQCLDVIVDKL